MDNTPLLIASNSTFNYVNFLFINNTPSDSVIDYSIVTGNFNKPSHSNLSVSQIVFTGSNVINNLLRNNQQTFPSDYNGPIIILIECTNTYKNLGRWHPIKAAKFFSTNFTGITNVKPGFKNVKITFDSIADGNLCLNSSAFLTKHGFTASIPTNLIYTFGIKVIKLDIDFLDCDF